MGKTIQKLNKLNNVESYIQINTFKGFKYIDKAGEIVNNFYIKDTPPAFSMDLNGLIIQKPVEKIDLLKVTPYVIWTKFTTIDSLDQIAQLYDVQFKKILPILEVEKLNRIGWRNFFVFEFQSIAKQKEYFKKIASVDSPDLTLISFDVEISDELKGHLIIQPVVKNDSDKTPGVLFDIDIFKAGETQPDGIGSFFTGCRQYLNNGFLDILNGTFK